MLSAKDVAQKLKVSEQHVRAVIRDGHLNATRVGSQWIIEEQDLHRYILENNVLVEPDDHPRIGAEIPRIVALSFFTGAMGLDIGLEQAGIKAVLACEVDKACRMTIQSNRPDMALIGDITKYSSEQILEMARIPRSRHVDVIFGGPPCQAFSTAGKQKAFSDQRGNVFLKYLSIINDIQPKYVIIENVRGLLSTSFPYDDDLSTQECFDNKQLMPAKGGAMRHVLRSLRESGYVISFDLYNAANFGAPQIRERVVMIGYRGKTKIPYLTPTHDESGRYGLPKWRTLNDAFMNLCSSEHHFVPFPEKRLQYYRMLKGGQYWKDLPADVQKKAMGKSFDLGGGKTGFYRRLSFDKPSPTLVTHPAMPATDLGHPTEDRPLSVEEYKAIQEFPDKWVICGTLLDQYRQLGNAVPIALGQAIGKTIMSHMDGIAPMVYPGYKYSRYQNTSDVNWLTQTKDEAKKMRNIS